ncbi:MAG: sulfatase-like hydrolase/transferase [Spirochaetes bacterium]|nr:sulfatase-like hydrolase/transferase [Spirochaetota bacterium]
MRPNILFINVDQQRYDALGFTGNPIVKTPHLDSLAANGMSFTEAYTPIPICCPARQSLLCSQIAEVHGGLWNYDGGAGFKMGGIAPHADMWPFKLKEAGYSTAYLGKWHVNPTINPTGFGYDRYIPERYPARRPAGNIWHSLEGIRALGMKDEGDVETSYTHMFAKDCVGTIKEFADRDAPWHVRLDFMHPHLPNFPAEPFASMYRPDNIPPWGSFNDTFTGKPYIQRQQLSNWGIENWTWKEWSQIVSQYYGVISQYDDALGRVFSFLTSQGLMKDTMIIYTTDHGDMTGSHRMMDKHYVMYQDITHVPMVIRHDGVIAPGSTNGDLINHYLDLGPTILDLLGLPIPSSYQGISMLPQLSEKRNDRTRTHITSSYNGQQFGLYAERMITDGRKKLVWNLTDVDEYYDLDTDPWEIYNLIADVSRKDEIQRMRTQLLQELSALKDPIVANPWMKHQLMNGAKL